MWSKSCTKGAVEKVTPVPPYGRQTKPPPSVAVASLALASLAVIKQGSVALFGLRFSSRLADVFSEPGEQNTTVEGLGWQEPWSRERGIQPLLK